MSSLLAAFDLGAPPKLLQQIYDAEKKVLRPIDLQQPHDFEFNPENFHEHLGDEL